MLLRWLSLTIGWLWAAAVLADTGQARYTVLMVGKPAGLQTAIVQPDGTRELTYEYNDRGRGPKLTSRQRLDRDGVPVSIEIHGLDYLKMPVTETFSAAHGIARWKNDAESGERKLTARAYYVSMNGIPGELALLANALLKAPGNRMPLLPDGEASLRRVSEATVRRGETHRRVIAYEIGGLGFTPSTVWLEPDGRFFASVSSWITVIGEGWEDSAPALLRQQDELDAKRTVDLARTLTRKPAGPVAIVNANLFDAQTGQSQPGSTVILRGNRIVSVGKADAVTVPAGAERIDARGRALLPGLWDMHVHMSPNDGLMHIAAGVTSVRDLANDDETLQRIKRDIEAGKEIGPRIVMSGFMDGRGPYAGPTKVFVDSEEEARAAIEQYARSGYSGIKIYSSINPALVPTIIQLAHAKGLRVSGHVPAFMKAEQFIAAGADEMQHINFVFLNFFFDQVQDTRTPARFTTVAERAATLDLASPPVRSFVQLLKEHHTVIDPTVGIFDDMFTTRPGMMSVGSARIADRLPPQVKRGLLSGGLPVPDGMDARYRESSRALLRMIKLLYDNGVTIVAGTDSPTGFALHRELELYVDAGISAPEVLQIATLGAARVAKRESELGSIAPGKLADLVLVDGDPAQRIGDIRRTALVIKDGQLFDPAALYRSVGVRPLEKE